ncbi:hypothetical protein GF371_03645 [Candidatus Woesearchaeota archaeon]|nr:hypothetical protein [Candidatus Woesearchaeota archaeon]
MVQLDPLSISLVDFIFGTETMSVQAAFLVFLVIFKIIMHVITTPPSGARQGAGEAKAEQKTSLGFMDNVMIYIAVIFFLPLWTLIPILLFQILRMNNLLPSIIRGPLDALSAKIPIQEHDPRHFSLFIFGSIIAMVIMKIPFLYSAISAYSGFSASLGNASWGINLILLLVVFLLFAHEKATVKGNLAQLAASFVAISFVAGFEWVVFYLFILAIRPYLSFLRKDTPQEQESRDRQLTYAGVPGGYVSTGKKGLMDMALDAMQMGVNYKMLKGAVAPAAAPGAPPAEKVPKAKIEKPETKIAGFGKPAPAEKLPPPEFIEESAQQGAKAEVQAAGAGSNKAAAAMLALQIGQNALASKRAAKESARSQAELKKVSSAEAAALRSDIRQLKGNVCPAFNLVLALIIAVAKDIADLFGLGAIPYADDLLVAIIFYFLLRKSKSGAATWGNFIVFAIEGTFGFFPTSTLLVLWAIFYEYILNKERWELRNSYAQLYGRRLFKYALAGVVIVMIVLGFAVFDLPAGKAVVWAQDKGLTDVPYQMERAKETLRLYNPIEIVDEWWERNLAIARGDYFVGEVESVQNKKLGIFVKKKPLGDKKFYRGVSARVSATVTGESLNTRKCRENLTSDCFVFFDCQVEDFGSANAYPRYLTMLDLAGGGARLDCDFTPLTSGPKKVIFKAYFDFQTKAYLPVVLVPYQSKIEKDREVLLAETGYSPLDLSVAKYTPGPVELGLGFEEQQPLGVGRLEIAAPAGMPITGSAVEDIPQDTQVVQPGFGISTDYGTPFGFNLRNLWRQGKIIAIQNISVILPDNMELFKCDPAFTSKPKFLPNTKEVEYNLLKPITTEEIETFRTFDCWVRQREGSERPLLTGSTTTYFAKIVANYRYQVEDAAIARVEEFTKRGKVVADVNQLSAYDYCSEEVKQNKCEYPSKNFCDTDPCLQNCFWEPADRGFVTGGVIGGALGAPLAPITLGTSMVAGAGLGAGAQYLLFGGAGCEECEEDMDCSDYEQNEHECSLDPCGIGCEWHKDNYCYRMTETDFASKLLFPVKSHYVSKCLEEEKIKINAENQEIVSVESGKLELKDGKIIIRHPYGYESTYEGLRAVRRIGNAAKNSIIGFATKDFEFGLKKDGKPIDLFKLYKDQVPSTVLRSTDPSCTGDENATRT